MKIYKKETVYEAALNRMRYIFDEFENVIASFSGGKDSTVILNLALIVAREKGRLPLKVCFLDQEAEWNLVIDYVKHVMYLDEVEPLWLQIPIKLFNATSFLDEWLYCWDENEKEKWIHPKNKIAIKKNRFGTDRFKEMFTKFVGVEYPDKKTCYLSGVRTEESRTRMMALTHTLKYKDITYGKTLNKKLQHYTFYPIYDWSYRDVWKAIHDNKWKYCEIYDYMYRYGLPINKMRVSNLHHETAVHSLKYLQEVEKDTWNKLTTRLSGINTYEKLKEDEHAPNELPFMFSSWKDYRDYLLENLIQDELVKKEFRKQFHGIDEMYIHKAVNLTMMKACIKSILCNDYHYTKLSNVLHCMDVANYRKWRQGKPLFDDPKYMKYIIEAQNEDNNNK